MSYFSLVANYLVTPKNQTPPILFIQVGMLKFYITQIYQFPHYANPFFFVTILLNTSPLPLALPCGLLRQTVALGVLSSLYEARYTAFF
jgi:hypothetical protein